MSNPSPGYSITVRVTAPVGADTTAALAGAVASTFKVPYVEVEVFTSDGAALSASHGRPTAETHVTDIAYDGERVGRLVLPLVGVRAMLSRRDQGLLVDLVRQAEGRVWLAQDRHPAARHAWRTGTGRVRNVGDPPPDVDLIEPDLEDAYLLLVGEVGSDSSLEAVS